VNQIPLFIQFYHLADKFARGFEEAYTALRRLEDSKSDLERIPSVDEKMQLSYDIFKVRCMSEKRSSTASLVFNSRSFHGWETLFIL
jgi:hypothetical protein